MESSYSIFPANPSDASSIATLFAQSWDTPFIQLQFGQSDPTTIATTMAPRIASQISDPGSRREYVVARYIETQEIVSVAQWNTPSKDDEAEDQASNETAEETEDRERFEDEIYRSQLPSSSNKHLIMDFRRGVRDMRARVLGDRRHYVLDNIATHAFYRRQGLATRLISSTIQATDLEGLPIYLEVASGNNAMRIYEKLGFQERGTWTIEDLGQYGGNKNANVAYLGMIRDPREYRERIMETNTITRASKMENGLH